jgi:hypothetical protein
MYNGSNHFGKAYQEELLRTAGVGDEQGIAGRRQSQSREPGLLIKLLGGLFGRRRAEPALDGAQRSTGNAINTVDIRTS